MFDPDTLRRPKIRPKEESASGFGGAPTSVRFPSRRSRLRYWLMSCSAGDGVEDEVEAAGVLLHLVGVAGDDDLVRAEAERVFLLAGRSGEDDDVSSERMGKLRTHVAQPAETDHAHFLTRRDAPVTHGRIRGDPGTEQRCDSG
jgi:hypothetical protein